MGLFDRLFGKKAEELVNQPPVKDSSSEDEKESSLVEEATEEVSYGVDQSSFDNSDLGVGTHVELDEVEELESNDNQPPFLEETKEVSNHEITVGHPSELNNTEKILPNSKIEESDNKEDEWPSELISESEAALEEENTASSDVSQSSTPFEEMNHHSKESATDNHFRDVMADYYAKKAAAQAALEKGEEIQFEAVETRPKEEVSTNQEAVMPEIESKQEKYNRSLKKTRTGFSARLNTFLANFRSVDEEFFEDLEEMLILSDVGVNVATQLTEDLRYEAKLENIKKSDDLRRLIIEKLVDIYEKDGVYNERINFQDNLTVMLFVGVNGVGKTTSIGKLAYKYKQEGKKVMLVAADTFRAGAVAQLVEWGRRVAVPVVTGPEKGDPASVVFDGMQKAVAEKMDILLIDTAGRLQNKDNLMAELEKMGRIIKRVIPNAPHETLLALDASTGQNALSQAKEFSKITPLTGLILTKIDGTAKGGVVLAIRQELDIPVKFIGFGEKIDDIGEFNSEDYMRGLLEGVL